MGERRIPALLARAPAAAGRSVAAALLLAVVMGACADRGPQVAQEREATTTGPSPTAGEGAGATPAPDGDGGSPSVPQRKPGAELPEPLRQDQVAHGEAYWTVFLMVFREGGEEPNLEEAVASTARSLGISKDRVGGGDIGCEEGGRPAVGENATLAVTAAFPSEDLARSFADGVEPRPVYAHGKTYCRD